MGGFPQVYLQPDIINASMQQLPDGFEIRRGHMQFPDDALLDDTFDKATLEFWALDGMPQKYICIIAGKGCGDPGEPPTWNSYEYDYMMFGEVIADYIMADPTRKWTLDVTALMHWFIQSDILPTFWIVSLDDLTAMQPTEPVHEGSSIAGVGYPDKAMRPVLLLEWNDEPLSGPRQVPIQSNIIGMLLNDQ